MDDRDAGRKTQGRFLKTSKSNSGSTVAKQKKATSVSLIAAGGVSLRLPQLTSKQPYVDCACAIMSRQFDCDRDHVLMRAKEKGCCAVLEWVSDIDKQEAMADFAKLHSGFLYFITGIHPNNVDRTNKKSHDIWIEKILDLGRRAECAGLLSGLNCSREIGTHFAQELLLTSTYKMAIEKLHVPLILHLGSDGESLDRALELLSGEDEVVDSHLDHIMIHDAISACAGDINRMHQAVIRGCFLMVTGIGLGLSNLGDSDEALLNSRTRELLREIPLRQLLVGSDSPWHTPQTLSDVYLRTQRNEPSNLTEIITAIADAIYPETSREELVVALKLNAMSFFGIENLPVATQELVSAGQENVLLPIQEEEEIETASTFTTTAMPKIAEDVCIFPFSVVEMSYFRCQRCRQKLFDLSDVVTHGSDVAKGKRVFKPGQEEGLCNAYVFLSGEQPWNTISNQKGGNAVCSNCGGKIGRFCTSGTLCNCGAEVSGSFVKITLNRVDFMDSSANAATLAARAQLEAAESIRNRVLNEEREKVATKTGKKHKSVKGKLRHAENRGNFSLFRDKSFIPNASRTVAARGYKVRDGDGDGDGEVNEKDI